MRDFSNLPLWSPCPEEHNDRGDNVTRLIKLAASMLFCGATNDEVRTKLLSTGCRPDSVEDMLVAGRIANK